MNHFCGILTAIAIVLIAGIYGCSRDATDENPMTAETDSEESTVQLSLSDTYDNVRNGAHLIMSYDAATNSFEGTVQNTTNAILSQVRVEVHLSNGVELGPTSPVDLAPGEQIPIVLVAEGPPFDRWTAHPEVGPMSSSGGEGAEGEGGEGGGEHAGGAEGGGN